jgi:hypothetical protein
MSDLGHVIKNERKQDQTDQGESEIEKMIMVAEVQGLFILHKFFSPVESWNPSPPQMHNSGSSRNRASFYLQ